MDDDEIPATTIPHQRRYQGREIDREREREGGSRYSKSVSPAGLTVNLEWVFLAMAMRTDAVREERRVRERMMQFASCLELSVLLGGMEPASHGCRWFLPPASELGRSAMTATARSLAGLSR